MNKQQTQLTTQDLALQAIDAPETSLGAAALTESGGLVLRTYGELMKFSQMMVQAKVVQSDDTWESVFVKVQAGAELGLGPMAAIQNIAVINNRPTVWGDALLALCIEKTEIFDLKAFREWWEIDGEELEMADVPIDMIKSQDPKVAARVIARCVSRRMPDGEPTEGSFSMLDAREGGLYPAKPAAAWCKYPKRMLQMRARAFCLRDAFPDVLRGLYVAEEVITHQNDQGQVIDAPSTPGSPLVEGGKAARQSRLANSLNSVPMSTPSHAEEFDDKAAEATSKREKAIEEKNRKAAERKAAKKAAKKKEQAKPEEPQVDPLDEIDNIGDEPSKFKVLASLISEAQDADRLASIVRKIQTLKDDLAQGSLELLRKAYGEREAFLEEKAEREAMQGEGEDQTELFKKGNEAPE